MKIKWVETKFAIKVKKASDNGHASAMANATLFASPSEGADCSAGFWFWNRVDVLKKAALIGKLVAGRLMPNYPDRVLEEIGGPKSEAKGVTVVSPGCVMAFQASIATDLTARLFT